MKCVVTGHRPHGLRVSWDAGRYERLRTLAKAALTKYAPDELYVGMAEGWDLACAEASLDLGLPFTAYLPCASQAARWKEPWAVYLHKRLLERAKAVWPAEPGPWREGCELERNRAMVDALSQEEDFVMALWNGQAQGGTAWTVRYAGGKGLKVVNLWGSWAKEITV